MPLSYASGSSVLPIFDENSRILILGSFPDVKACEHIGFCYIEGQAILEAIQAAFEKCLKYEGKPCPYMWLMSNR